METGIVRSDAPRVRRPPVIHLLAAVAATGALLLVAVTRRWAAAEMVLGLAFLLLVAMLGFQAFVESLFRDL